MDERLVAEVSDDEVIFGYEHHPEQRWAVDRSEGVIDGHAATYYSVALTNEEISALYAAELEENP